MRERNPSIELPTALTYTETLRYLVQSAPEDAPELPFLVSLWSYAIKNDGLTPKQQKALQPYIDEAAAWIKYHRAQEAPPRPITYSGNVVPLYGNSPQDHSGGAA